MTLGWRPARISDVAGLGSDVVVVSVKFLAEIVKTGFCLQHGRFPLSAASDEN